MILARNAFTLGFIAAAISGCTAPRTMDEYPGTRATSWSRTSEPPSDSEIASLEYGKKPSNYQSIFKKDVLAAMRDPDSAKIRNIKAPRKFWGKITNIQNGWLICGEVNAKNAYGGYTGYEKTAVLVFKDGSHEYMKLDEGRPEFLEFSAEYPCAD